ncbi:MAG: type V CRISPR-associated protein Cas12b [Phycisphaeraceae bacterium]|nr:type V CRISPR-associated protein Cas12b [Phycisphaeraceae bacterium]MCW5762777.1 type V CRISPR-associated protein Cas12b [Phycisphaeraceae bacterium]
MSTTTRSYTLGLLSTSDAADWLPLWKRLFQTHYAVCCGAREFGEFFLNLRGGLPASLASCDAEPDPDRRRLLQRGARRVLALGWFSVESLRGAEHHPHRLVALGPGESLTKEAAGEVLRTCLQTSKGLTDQVEIGQWVNDCALALCANIRADAVIVNRAAAFSEWQCEFGESGADMPEQARRILFAMCGTGFASLTLPKDETVKEEEDREETEPSDEGDSEDTETKKSKSETEEAVEPSNASRGVYCDLFGGDPGPKVKRELDKIRFAAMLYEFLSPLAAGNQVWVFLDRTNLFLGETLHRCDPERSIPDQLRDWRTLHGWGRNGSDLLPREASPDNKVNKIAVPYRKLLVAADLWPKSNDEDGAITHQHDKAGIRVQDNLKKAAITTSTSPGMLGLIESILKACAKRVTAEDLRVFKPQWAEEVQNRFERAARVGEIRRASEFRYLMFALAARRISQTQTWMKRNETERHKAAVREDAANKVLDAIDPDRAARGWLAAYEEKRGEHSQPTSEFRITRRMIGECEAVFKAWQGIESPEDRERETASVQSKAEKFGDALFYADLSGDLAAEVIWKNERGAELLKQWVKWRQAQHDQRRFKIPRFCHPDAFHHPTWCEFGGTSKPNVWYAWRPDSKPQNPESGGNNDGSRRLWMLLPDFNSRQAAPVPMRWRCKRLSNDLGGVREYTEVSVPRADRISLAAARLPSLDTNNEPIRYRPEHPFTKSAKGWNARLQLDRNTLERLEQEWDESRRDWRDDGKDLRFARWFVTFAPELVTMEGPGRNIHPKLGWKGSPHTDLNKKEKREIHAKLILSRLPGLRVQSVDLGHRFAASCAVWEAIDREQMKAACREHGQAEPRESDLYLHLTRTVQKERTKGRDKGKTVPVEETTIYRRIGEDYLRDPKTGKPTETPHPAPWARLERQFSIKLPGEDKPARAATRGRLKDGTPTDIDEEKMVARLACSLGYRGDIADKVKGRGVDELMRRAVWIASTGLTRHGRRAKIAYALDPACPYIPGMGDKRTAITRGDAEHIEFLTKTLADWHALAVDTSWDGTAERELWNEHIQPLQGVGFAVGEPARVDPEATEISRQQRRKNEDEFRETRIKPIAEYLSKAKPDMTKAMHAGWRQRWEGDDGEGRTKADFVHAPVTDENGVVIGTRTTPKPGKESGGGWHGHLRELTDWIMGRHLDGASSPMWTRNVGGLSLTRIGTMQSLYRLHKQFAMRPKPDNVRGAPEKGESNAGVAQRILDTMERMREQRVKQIASRIAASALGLGGHWKQVIRRDHAGRALLDARGRQRTKSVWVEEPSARYAPCHAIVIENLRNYKFADTQPRRENRGLMSWSAGKVRKYLEEACQLSGLHLREVSPNYTSRQCSRTGLPGHRCQDISVADFLDKAWCRKRVRQAKERKENSTKDRPFDAAARFFVALDELWPDRSSIPKAKQEEYTEKVNKAKPLRILSKSGDLFVAAPPRSCRKVGHQPCPLCDGKRAIQADLNAAANIGLRALLDPDFAGRWWYVPASIGDGWRVPMPKSCAGAACLDGWKVATKQGKAFLCADGSPLGEADDETVKKAKLQLEEAKRERDAAKRAAKKKGADQSLLAQTQARYEVAKKAHDDAKKAASQKEIINLWKDPDAQPGSLNEGAWWEPGAYWRMVEHRVMARLRLANGLVDNPIPERDDDLETPF